MARSNGRTSCVFAICIALTAAACNGTEAQSTLVPPTPTVLTSDPVPSGNEADEVATPSPTLARLLIEPDTLLLGEGMEATLSATGLTADGVTVEPTVVWRSLSPSRLAVTDDGVVTSVGPRGPGFITATAGELVVEIPVRVVPPSELPPEPEPPEEGSASPPEPLVVVRGAEADPAVEVDVATAALIGTWETSEMDGSQRIVTFHDGGRLLDERRRPNPGGEDRGQRRLGRWQLQVVETTRMRLDFVYDDAQFGRDALLCEPPTAEVLDCGPTVLRRRG